MLRVGLTGGIGSGKSTVARALIERGAFLIDSDVLAREVVAPGTEGLALIRDRFGDSVIGANGSLDRAALGSIVFGDESARDDLNAIVHPRVLAETRARMARAAEEAVVVHDIPLLVELGREADYHLVVVVAAGQDVRLRRLIEDRGMAKADARARIAAQASDEQRRAAADVWLSNEGDLNELTACVDRLWRDRLAPFEHNLRTRTPVSRDSTVGLVEPDPAWATVAARLLGRLRTQVVAAGLGEGVGELEHIGSTAVPGLVAKDVIDLQLTVDDLSLATSPVFENALLAAGFAPSRAGRQAEAQPNVDTIHSFAPDPGEWVKVTYAGCDPGRVAHLHIRRAGSAAAESAVQFRDWLRAHPQERDAYAALKRRVAGEHPGGSEATREECPEAKEPWFAEPAAGPGVGMGPVMQSVRDIERFPGARNPTGGPGRPSEVRLTYADPMTVTEAATPTRPFEIFDVRVARTSRITPHLVRVTFAGEELAHFADCGYDQRIKLILPPRRGSLDAMPRGEDWFTQWRSLPDERKPPIRTYTVRAVRAEQREIDVDLVDHGDLGPASAFARSAQRGDRVMVFGPNARHAGPYGGLEFRADLADQTDLLLVGDDTAAPAICAILERLPAQARGLVCLEVEHADAVQDIDAPTGVRVEWRVRQGERGAAQTTVVREWLDAHPLVGTGSGGATTVVDDGEESGYWEVTTDRGEGVPPLAAWIAGESSVVKAMRRVLVQEFEIPRSAVAFMGYWRQGFSEC